jgi:Family of unknown function (DUF6221)
MSNGLIPFMTARLDEDEAAAKSNIAGGLSDDGEYGPSWPDYQTYDGEDLNAATTYIEHFRPRRELREVAAKRAIVRRCERQAELASENCMEEDRTWVLWPVLFELAAVYSDHPDYQPKWKPKPAP